MSGDAPSSTSHALCHIDCLPLPMAMQSFSRHCIARTRSSFHTFAPAGRGMAAGPAGGRLRSCRSAGGHQICLGALRSLQAEHCARRRLPKTVIPGPGRATPAWVGRGGPGVHAAVFPRKPWLIIRMLSRVCPLSLKLIVNVHNIATIVQVPGVEQTK
eukprot:SAG22_NODE_585_length_8867_cov_11.509580_2_plen_158_part_00